MRDGSLTLEKVWKPKSTTQTNKNKKSKFFSLEEKEQTNPKLT